MFVFRNIHETRSFSLVDTTQRWKWHTFIYKHNIYEVNFITGPPFFILFYRIYWWQVGSYNYRAATEPPHTHLKKTLHWKLKRNSLWVSVLLDSSFSLSYYYFSLGHLWPFYRLHLQVRGEGGRNPYPDNADVMWVGMIIWDSPDKLKIALISSTGERHRLKWY